MELHVHEHTHIVEVWLTSNDQKDRDIQEHLKNLYANYKASKYTVAVFHSGERELYHSTLDLLKYNKRRSAEIEANVSNQVLH